MAQLGRDERFGRSTKREPVYAEVTQYPKMLYKVDRTFITVNSKSEQDSVMSENKKDNLVWAESPLAFGIETAPSAPTQEELPGKW